MYKSYAVDQRKVLTPKRIGLYVKGKITAREGLQEQ